MKQHNYLQHLTRPCKLAKQIKTSVTTNTAAAFNYPFLLLGINTLREYASCIKSYRYGRELRHGTMQLRDGATRGTASMLLEDNF